MEMTGAQVVVECLLEQGVDTVFGYPGGTILNIYDELYKYQDKITHYLTAHEQGAAPERWGYVWPLPDRGQPTSPPESPLRIWTRRQLFLSAAT